jgi:2'-5' RNA ligase
VSTLSLNVPAPGAVSRLAADIAPELSAFRSVRDRHTLVAKRFESGTPETVRTRLRETVAPLPAFEARTDGLGVFESPPRGVAPVVYVAVESPGLSRLHESLVAAFGAVEGLEGPDYVPHVTLARGGSVETARRLAATDVADVSWTVSRLELWDPTYREAVGRIGLPLR